MKANEFITELFDKPLQWHWTVMQSDHMRAIFEIGDIQIAVHFDISDDIMQITFVDTKSTGYGLTNKFKDASPVKIFSTLISIIKDAVYRVNPKVFGFTAALSVPSRVSLYTKLATSIKIPDYTLSTSNIATKKRDKKEGRVPSKMFVFTKK